jgi:hypothetical protein
MDDGTVRIQPLHGDDAGLMGPYWSLTVHDNDHGTITQLAMSFDCKYLFSVGNDGNFFAFLVMDDKKLEKKVAEARATIPSAKVSVGVISTVRVHRLRTNLNVSSYEPDSDQLWKPCSYVDKSSLGLSICVC